MHDKLKLFLTKISLPEEYYSAFDGVKILKLKLDSTRKNGVFVIEVENILEEFNIVSEKVESLQQEIEVEAEFKNIYDVILYMPININLIAKK